MTKERLKEIKDSIEFQLSVCDIPEYETSKLLAEEELELYNEVVRLREIINHAEDLKHIKEMCMHVDEIENLTLEQLNGVENA